MIDLLSTPASILLITSVILYFTPRALFKMMAFCGSILSIISVWILILNPPQGIFLSVVGFTLHFLHFTYLTPLFLLAFSIIFFLNLLFNFGNKNYSKIETIAAFIYGASGLFIIIACDLISIFFFLELMTISATIIIFSNNTSQSYSAAKRYLLVHLFAGIMFLVGTIIYIQTTGHASITHFQVTSNFTKLNLASLFILIGILINAGSLPFASWIADSYPESSPAGACFLSVYTTKTSVFLLLSYFSGNQLLIYLGIAMIFFGIIYAILENDIRRILAYSLVNQVGFMVLAAGIGTQLAIQGAALHAFCHIFYKTLLFMSAGTVIFITKKHKCTELGGLHKSMRYTSVCAIIGAASISGFPLTSGFISKSIIVDSAHSNIWIWSSLIVASAGVFLHAGLEYPWFTFFQNKSHVSVKPVPILMKTAMGITAFICIYLGINYHLIYNLLSDQVKYQPYSWQHISEHSQLLLSSAIAFFFLLPLLKRENTISLDLDFLYRKLPSHILNVLNKIMKPFQYSLANLTNNILKIIDFIIRALISGPILLPTISCSIILFIYFILSLL